jgi:poly(A) polymerase
LNAPNAPLGASPSLARVIPRDQHPISRQHISPDALRVLYRLKDAGFQAFLVGGCVRDLLLRLTPKDFDVATDALPEQVKQLFRNCRLVGRRFRLAHVFFGRETIEVATFRASAAPPPGEDPAPDLDADGDEEFELTAESAESSDSAAPARDPRFDPETDDGERVTDAEGRILRDNIYGSIDEDVWRRDFTANSLYYNIADFSVWDYVGGVEDVMARRLKLIGDPETRFREDPVRMLRAARFEAKLGFTIDGATAEPIPRLRELLAGVPPARLFDETLKLFLAGHGLRSLEVLRARGLLAALLPCVDDFLVRYPNAPIEKLLRRGLENTDRRVGEGRSVTPTFLFAVLLYGPVALAIEKQPRERWTDTQTILDAVDGAVREVLRRVSIPKRFTLGVRDMFAMQPRLESPRGRRALRLLEHPKFRAALDLLQLRAEAGVANPESVRWWESLQRASPAERERLADASAQQRPREGGARRGSSRRRRRSRPRPGPN